MGAAITIPSQITDTVSRASKTAVHAAVAAYGSSAIHVTPLNALESLAVAGGAAGISAVWNGAKHAARAYLDAYAANAVQAAKDAAKAAAAATPGV